MYVSDQAKRNFENFIDRLLDMELIIVSAMDLCI